MRDIIHGNITPNTCYLVRQKKKEPHCRFAFNILDTNYFTEDNFEGIEDKLFQSEGQTLGQSKIVLTQPPPSRMILRALSIS